MSLLAKLLDDLDGESVVQGDAATVRLDAALAEARALPPATRVQLQIKVVELKQDTLAQLAVRRTIEADLRERAGRWETTARETKSEALATQATERAALLVGDAAGVTEEIAEYEATCQRLDEIYALLDRAGTDELPASA